MGSICCKNDDKAGGSSRSRNCKERSHGHKGKKEHLIRLEGELRKDGLNDQRREGGILLTRLKKIMYSARTKNRKENSY